jgi:hypothetical protein
MESLYESETVLKNLEELEDAQSVVSWTHTLLKYLEERPINTN